MIAERFCGPPGAGNGGYVCGRLASLIDAPVVEVTLRRPIPLEAPLSVADHENGSVSLQLDGASVAEAKPSADLILDHPPQPSFEDALRAMPGYIGFARHGFPRCFVCGTARDDGDGLRIFPGPLEGYEHTVAAPWTPDASLADVGGVVRPEFMWAALDCPGAFALMGDRSRPMVLGRMTGAVKSPVEVGERCVVLAWRIEVDGRKQTAGSVLFSEDGSIAAVAKAIWFDIVPQST